MAPGGKPSRKVRPFSSFQSRDFNMEKQYRRGEENTVMNAGSPSPGGEGRDEGGRYSNRHCLTKAQLQTRNRMIHAN
jgi:hypothetical protein